MAIESNWYVVDFKTNPSFITTSSINTDSIDVFGGISALNGTFTSNITTPRLSGNVLVTGQIKSKSNIAGYMFNGSTLFETYPIVCSLKGFQPADRDDYYIVNPGFKFELYDGSNYSNKTGEHSNDGDSPIVVTPSSPNTMASIKVFYRNTQNDQYEQITCTGLS